MNYILIVHDIVVAGKDRQQIGIFESPQSREIATRGYMEEIEADEDPDAVVKDLVEMIWVPVGDFSIQWIETETLEFPRYT